jgi:hypothetical protein
LREELERFSGDGENLNTQEQSQDGNFAPPNPFSDTPLDVSSLGHKGSLEIVNSSSMPTATHTPSPINHLPRSTSIPMTSSPGGSADGTINPTYSTSQPNLVTSQQGLSGSTVPPISVSQTIESSSFSTSIGAPRATLRAGTRSPQTSPPTQTQLAHLRTSLHLLSLPVTAAIARPSGSKGKDVLHFIISVKVRSSSVSDPGPLWSIAKTHSDCHNLEGKWKASVKISHHGSSSVHRLPEKSFFTVTSMHSQNSSQELELRRAAIEIFLTHVVGAVVDAPFCPLTQQLVDFISSDLVDPQDWEASERPNADVSNSSTSSVSGGGGFFGHDGGISRLLKKASNNPLARSRQVAQQESKKIMVNSFNPVFGVPLEQAISASTSKGGPENVPAVVFRCIEYLDHRAAHREEGIYRLSGSSATIRSLKDRFNSEGDVDLVNDLSLGEYLDVHAVSGLLKLFFRELPGSILTEQLHSRFMQLQEVVDLDERLLQLGNLILSLPSSNHAVLRALIAHLVGVVAHSEVNKMTVRNIGIVFAPTLGIPAGIFAMMLMEFEAVFDCPGRKKLEEKPLPIPDESDNSSSKQGLKDNKDFRRGKRATMLIDNLPSLPSIPPNSPPVDPAVSQMEQAVDDIMLTYATIQSSSSPLARENAHSFDAASMYQESSLPSSPLSDAALTEANDKSDTVDISRKQVENPFDSFDAIMRSGLEGLDLTVSPIITNEVSATELSEENSRSSHQPLTFASMDSAAVEMGTQGLVNYYAEGPSRSIPYGPDSSSQLQAPPPRVNSRIPRNKNRDSMYLGNAISLASEAPTLPVPPKLSSPGFSTQGVSNVEANLNALLRTDRDGLARELSNMTPSQLAALQAILRERSGSDNGNDSTPN